MMPTKGLKMKANTTPIDAPATPFGQTSTLRAAPAATLAPLHYLEIVSAVALGYTIFGDFPDALTWAGIAIIVASGLYIIARERHTARQPATLAIAVGLTPQNLTPRDVQPDSAP